MPNEKEKKEKLLQIASLKEREKLAPMDRKDLSLHLSDLDQELKIRKSDFGYIARAVQRASPKTLSMIRKILEMREKEERGDELAYLKCTHCGVIERSQLKYVGRGCLHCNFNQFKDGGILIRLKKKELYQFLKRREEYFKQASKSMDEMQKLKSDEFQRKIATGDYD